MFNLTHYRRGRWIIPLILMGSAATHAAPEKMDFPTAVRMALEQNPTLAATAEQIENARAQQRAARGGLLPRLDLNVEASRTNAPLGAFAGRLSQQRVTAADFDPARLNDPEDFDNVKTTVRLSWPVWQGGALWAGKRRAESALEAATYSYGMGRQKLTLDVLTAYTGVHEAQAQQEASREALQAAQQHARVVRAQQEQGMAVESDVMTAEVHRLNAEVELRKAENAVADASDRLAVLLNLEPGSALSLGPVPAIPPLQESLEELQRMAVESRPDLLALQAMMKAQRAAVRMEQAAFYPSLQLMAQREWNDDTLALENDNTTVAGVVQFNLFAGGTHKAKVDGARAELARLRHQLEGAQRAYRAEVARAWRGREEARSRAVAQKKAERQAAEALRIVELRFKAGLERTVDLLQAQARLNAARAQRIHTDFELIRAEARLRMAAGRLSLEEIQ